MIPIGVRIGTATGTVATVIGAIETVVTSSFGFIEAIRCRAAGPAASVQGVVANGFRRQGLPPYKLYHQQILNRYWQLTNANSGRVING
jgi:hypothetical protein